MGVVFLVIGEILCYLGQEFFSKLFSITHPGKASDVTPIFNVLFGAVVALATWIYNGFRLNPDWITLLIGIINLLFKIDLSVPLRKIALWRSRHEEKKQNP